MTYMFERWLVELTNVTYIVVSLCEILELWNTGMCLHNGMVGVMKNFNHNAINVPL